jgi:hypothetical protein
MERKAVDLATKNCERCGTSFGRNRYMGVLEDSRRFRSRRFCSLSCANTRDILTKHGYSWRARKHLKASCEACGGQRSRQAHHIDQDKTNNEPTNIQTLCKWCHDFHHSTAKRLGIPVAGKMAFLGLLRASLIESAALEPSEMPSSRSKPTRSSKPSRKSK